MKILIASDIHGSEVYCRQLLERYKEEKCDRMLFLGDILYHGPRNGLTDFYDPKKVIDMLNEYKDSITSVRGNCDAEVDQVVLQFPIMADYTILYHGKHMIYATHGHIYGEQNPPPTLRRGDVLLCGHTHVPVCNEYDDFTYINPGSVTLPKGGSERSYIVFEDGKFTFKTLEGKTYKEFELAE